MKSIAHRPWHARLLRRHPKPIPPLGRLAFDAFTGEYTSIITSFDGANHITFTETGLEAWHAAELRRHERQVRVKVAKEILSLIDADVPGPTEAALEQAARIVRGEEASDG